MFKLIRAAVILGGVGIVIKELLEVDKTKKKANNSTTKEKPKSFFDEMKEAVKDEVEKVKTEVGKMKNEFEKVMTPPTKTKTTPKQKTDTESKASPNGNGKASIKDIKDFKEVKKSSKKTTTKAKPTAKSKAKSPAKTKKTATKKTTVKVEEEAVIRYKAKDKESTVKGKVTKKINELLKNAKSFKIGKTGNIKDVEMDGYKKLNLVCVSSKATNINKLATYYNTKYAKSAKNKTESITGKLTSKDGEYYLYILVK